MKRIIIMSICAMMFVSCAKKQSYICKSVTYGQQGITSEHNFTEKQLEKFLKDNNKHGGSPMIQPNEIRTECEPR